MAPDATPTGRTQYTYMQHDIYTGGVGVVGGFAARRWRGAARCPGAHLSQCWEDAPISDGVARAREASQDLITAELPFFWWRLSLAMAASAPWLGALQPSVGPTLR